jgi:transcription initiation factor IIE alpha subunit
MSKNKLPFVVSDWVLAQKLRPLEIIILAIIESKSRFTDDKLKEQTDITNKQLTNYVYRATINTVRMAVYRLKQKKLITVSYGKNRKNRVITLNR